MADKTMVVTRRLELYVHHDVKEERAKHYAFIRSLSKQVFRAANEIISDQWLMDRILTRLSEPDQLRLEGYAADIDRLHTELKKETDEAIKLKIQKAIESAKKKRNEVYIDAKAIATKTLKELVGVGTQQMSWQLIIAKYKAFRSAITDALLQKITKDFRSDYIDVVNGRKSVRRYKQGMPIPFRGNSMSFEFKDNKYLVNWIEGIQFGINFGRDRGSRMSEISKILAGEYSYGDSAIQIKDGKLYLLLSLKHPTQPLKAESGKVLMVEAGIKIPVSCYVDKSDEPAVYGSADDIIRFRLQKQSRYHKLQKALVISIGGHGRQKKLAKLEDLKKLENNWIQTYNHKLSKSVVNFAIRNRCSQIHIIEWQLDKEMSSEEKLKFEGRNWAGHMLKTMIQYKCKMHHIAISSEEKVIQAGVTS